tara:strand:+ start:1255 stop:1572 length:318 start_codon:yes stop_codon:yes gene_type:complete
MSKQKPYISIEEAVQQAFEGLQAGAEQVAECDAAMVVAASGSSSIAHQALDLVTACKNAGLSVNGVKGVVADACKLVYNKNLGGKNSCPTPSASGDVAVVGGGHG